MAGQSRSETPVVVVLDSQPTRALTDQLTRSRAKPSRRSRNCSATTGRWPACGSTRRDRSRLRSRRCWWTSFTNSSRSAWSTAASATIWATTIRWGTRKSRAWASGHCICENCLAWDHPDGEPRVFHWKNKAQQRPALSDRDVTFANKLADLLKQRYPPPQKMFMHRCGNGAEAAAQFELELELKTMIGQHFNAPSIVWRLVFNEARGQYDTPRLTKLTKDRDSTRIVCNASSWYDAQCGDVIDWHRYPRPPATRRRPDCGQRRVWRHRDGRARSPVGPRTGRFFDV